MAERPKRKWDEPESAEVKPVLDPAAQAGTFRLPLSLFRRDNPGLHPPSLPSFPTHTAAIAAKIAATMGASRPSGPPRDDSKDGAFTFDIEINDLRNRYLLTKGSTQAQIGGETGASIVTKGIWLPDKSKATAQDPPLYLHIAASDQEMLDKAVGKVSEQRAASVASNDSLSGASSTVFCLPASGASIILSSASVVGITFLPQA